jgi:phage major head subunit gpT-like protein
MYDQLTLLGKKIKAAFGKVFQGEANTELQSSICEVIKSDKDKEQFSFTFLFSQIREWVDKAVFETGKAYEYFISNKKWQLGLAVDKDYAMDVKSDTVIGGELQLNISGLAKEFTEHADTLINDALVANGTAFDNTAFFATSRPNIPNSSTIDNLHTGTGITLAQIETDLGNAEIKLKGHKIKGKPVNKNAKLVVLCPTHLTRLFRQLASNETIILGGVSTSNEWRGSFEIIENEEQSQAINDWYLINKNAKMKPMILQKRLEPEYQEIDDKETDQYKYNWKARYNVGYGNPLAIVKVDN